MGQLHAQLPQPDPLWSAAEVTRIERGVIETLAFDRVYGAWWDAVVPDDARAKVLRSADRYVPALQA